MFLKIHLVRKSWVLRSFPTARGTGCKARSGHQVAVLHGKREGGRWRPGRGPGRAGTSEWPRTQSQCPSAGPGTPGLAALGTVTGQARVDTMVSRPGLVTLSRMRLVLGFPRPLCPPCPEDSQCAGIRAGCAQLTPEERTVPHPPIRLLCQVAWEPTTGGTGAPHNTLEFGLPVLSEN